MAPTTTMKRILSESSELTRNPSPDFHASPASDSDLFTWHFTIRGPPSSPYAAGIYHGRIVLPPNYPYKPPHFRFYTPSGRFEVNRDICLSMSGHHEETWQPAWGIRTALLALRSFMESEPEGQLGGLDCNAKERERIASQTPKWHCESCARSNEDIIREVEAAAAEKEKKDGKKVEEKAIPSDLTISWKSETGQTEKEAPSGGETAEVAELAEGFVRTTDSAADTQLPPAPSSRPAQDSPAQNNTRIQHQPQPQLAQQRPHFPTHQRSNDGVPVWIDRAISGVVVLLAAMLLKVLLGL